MAQVVRSDEDGEGGDHVILQPGDSLPKDYTDRYWWIVRRTLAEVFKADEKVIGRADELKGKTETLDPLGQIQFYHAEPLDVASDLAERPGAGAHRVITAEEKRVYLGIKGVAEKDLPSLEQLAYTAPED